METRYDKSGRLFYQTSPVALPKRNAANIPPYKGYHRESFYEGVFITLRYSKAR